MTPERCASVGRVTPGASQSTTLPAGRHTVPLTLHGRDRPYILHVPPIAPADGAPFVLQLHGRGIDPIMFDRWTGFSALADEAGFILAMPSAAGEAWNDGRYGSLLRDGPDDVGYLLALLDDARFRVPIDRRRIYLVGMSNGATMAARFVCEHPEQVAAFAQVAGTAAEAVARACRPAVPVPILNVHGTRDRYAPYAGGRARGLRARLVLRHPAGPCVGVDEWARRWVDGNRALDGPHAETIPPDASVRRWRGPTPACDAAFYRIDGGGHTWPGNRAWVPPVFGRTSRAFDATRVAWDFFAEHTCEA